MLDNSGDGILTGIRRGSAKGNAGEPTAPEFTREHLETSIARLEKRLTEVEMFDPSSVSDQFHHPELDALKSAVEDSLCRTFGERTSDYRRFQQAANFTTGAIYTGSQKNLYEIRRAVAQSRETSIAMLKQAIVTLKERQDEVAAPQPSARARPSARGDTRRVFVVHGHDEGARETVARYLEKINFEPIVLHEQANQGRTVMEKIEAHGDVDFAVVLLTADDEGRPRGGELKPRARQNVLLELGYFLGRLPRANVCALKKGELEIPSDFAGVVWTEMDAGGGWRTALARELQASGHEIDWNLVMRQ